MAPSHAVTPTIAGAAEPATAATGPVVIPNEDGNRTPAWLGPVRRPSPSLPRMSAATPKAITALARPTETGTLSRRAGESAMGAGSAGSSDG